jgi:2-amino-4-hydroxy-6-hydroxymethyldihydropteridine diphosphokinase
MNQVVLLTGSNMDSPGLNLERAKLLLSKRVGEIVLQSSIYESEPWGFEHQSYFLNQVLVLHTEFYPLQVLSIILEIEKELGRHRQGAGYQARIIDIDILYYNKQVIHELGLKVPHPLLQDRRFTLEPLAEVLPDYVHPVLNKSNRQLLKECSDNSIVKKTSAI